MTACTRAYISDPRLYKQRNSNGYTYEHFIRTGITSERNQKWKIYDGRLHIATVYSPVSRQCRNTI